MAIADTTEFWTSRMHGENPTSLTQPHHNDDFTVASGSGAAEGDFWRITNGLYSAATFTTNDLTALVSFRYNAIPADTTTLLTLRNASHKITIQSTGTGTSLRIVGATNVIISDLDLMLTEIDSTSTVIRVSLTSAGAATVYVYESMESEDGEDAFFTLTGATDSSGRLFQFGNTAGTVDWGTVYFTHHGAFSPDELSQSGLYQMVMNRLVMSIRDTLRNSKRMDLKEVLDSSIVIGYDLSSDMMTRIRPPTVHIIPAAIGAPDFNTIGGSAVDNDLTVDIMVSTKGRDYRDAYRFGMRIIGDIFDELYTGTGLENTKDALRSYELILDARIDPDEQVCIHRLQLTYMRRERMLFR